MDGGRGKSKERLAQSVAVVVVVYIYLDICLGAKPAIRPSLTLTAAICPPYARTEHEAVSNIYIIYSKYY